MHEFQLFKGYRLCTYSIGHGITRKKNGISVNNAGIFRVIPWPFTGFGPEQDGVRVWHRRIDEIPTEKD
jgi:hypothetical protein